MPKLLFCEYATGLFSGRKQERATYDSVAFRYIGANDSPDHDTIATFRKLILSELIPLFAQALGIAKEMGFLKLSKVSHDGTRIKADASKDRALSRKHGCKLEAQLKAEVERRLRQAEEADRTDLPDGLDIPDEIARREERLGAIIRAKAEIEERAAERHAEDQEEYSMKLAGRKTKEEATGKKVRGKRPTEEFSVQLGRSFPSSLPPKGFPTGCRRPTKISWPPSKGGGRGSFSRICLSAPTPSVCCATKVAT